VLRNPPRLARIRGDHPAPAVQCLARGPGRKLSNQTVGGQQHVDVGVELGEAGCPEFRPRIQPAWRSTPRAGWCRPSGERRRRSIEDAQIPRLNQRRILSNRSPARDRGRRPKPQPHAAIARRGYAAFFFEYQTPPFCHRGHIREHRNGRCRSAILSLSTINLRAPNKGPCSPREAVVSPGRPIGAPVSRAGYE